MSVKTKASESFTISVNNRCNSPPCPSVSHAPLPPVSTRAIAPGKRDKKKGNKTPIFIKTIYNTGAPNHQAAVSGVSFSANTGTFNPRSGAARTNCSCLLALKKSLTARIKINQPTIISAYANHSLLATLDKPPLLSEASVVCACATATAAAVAAAESAILAGSKSLLFGFGGGLKFASGVEGVWLLLLRM